MFRLVFVLLAVAFSDPLLGLTCLSSAQESCKPCYRPTADPEKRVENKWSDVEELKLDKTELQIPAPEGSPPVHVDHSPNMAVGVEVTASDPEGDVLTYAYTVSGGRIVGAGTKVFWDLNRVRAGTYTITAAVDDGCGLCGKKVTRTVTVTESENAPKCVCSKITIDAPHLKKRTAERIFKTNLTGPERTGLTFNWTISESTIIAGQGTDTIWVEPSNDPHGRQITVTVEITGLDPGCECPTTAARTFTY
jgi:hypothetical protein